MTQSNEANGYQGTTAIKTFEFENTRSGAKLCDHWEKRKTRYARQIIGDI